MTAPARFALAIVLLGGAVGGYWWWNSPERQIRRTLDELARRASHDAPAQGLTAIAAVAGLREYLAEDVSLAPGEPYSPLNGRDTVLAAAARVRSVTPSLRMAFEDVRIALEPGGTATVHCTVTAALRDRAGQERIDARELTMTLQRSGGRWVLTHAASVNVLEPVT